MSDSFKELILCYRLARKAHEDALEHTEKLYKDRAQLERQVVEAMLEGNHRRLDHDGALIYLSDHVGVAVNQQNQADVVQWLNTRRGGVDDFMVLQLDGARVKRMVRKELEDGALPSEYPDFMKVSTRPRLNVRGWGAQDDGGGDA